MTPIFELHGTVLWCPCVCQDECGSISRVLALTLLVIVKATKQRGFNDVALADILTCTISQYIQLRSADHVSTGKDVGVVLSKYTTWQALIVAADANIVQSSSIVLTSGQLQLSSTSAIASVAAMLNFPVCNAILPS